MFIFKREVMVPAIEEAQKLNCRIKLVKDDGVYFMSEKGGKNLAYATGHDPRVDRMYDIYGSGSGSDFVEYFDPFEHIFLALMELTDVDVQVAYTPTEVSFLLIEKRLSETSNSK